MQELDADLLINLEKFGFFGLKINLEVNLLMNWYLRHASMSQFVAAGKFQESGAQRRLGLASVTVPARQAICKKVGDGTIQLANY